MTKNLGKGPSIRKNIISIMSLQIFLEWFVIKKKIARDNEAPFVTKEPSKATLNRSKLTSRHTKCLSRENFLAFKKQENICKMGMGNKQFWNTVKPFVTSKGFLHNEDIALQIGDKTVTDCNELAKEFNEYYINIGQNTTGKATIKLQGSSNDKSCRNHCRISVETIIKT